VNHTVSNSTTNLDEPRVMQVVLGLSPGGTERLVIELTRRLRSTFGMPVCCLDEEGAWGRALVSEGCDVVALHRQAGLSPSLGLRIAELASARGATILHCHHYSPFVYGALAKLRNRCKVIFTEHGRLNNGPISIKRRVANQLLSRSADRVFAVSGDLKSHLVAEGFSPRQVQVIYNGIEIGPLPSREDRCRARQRLGYGDEDFVVAAVGRLDPVKDLATLVSAAELCARAGARIPFVLFGDGPERQLLEELIRQKRLQSVVRLFGHSDEVRTYLPGADAYLNTSVFEGVSLTILEAMAAGLPVVAT